MNAIFLSKKYFFEFLRRENLIYRKKCIRTDFELFPNQIRTNKQQRKGLPVICVLYSIG